MMESNSGTLLYVCTMIGLVGLTVCNTAWNPASSVQPPCKETNSCLICFECISADQAGCGEPFNPWIFQPVVCMGTPGVQVKCAIQKQEPNDGALFSAVARGCYEVNQVQGLNDSDGCRSWTNPSGYTARYCFCSQDICNSSQRGGNHVTARHVTLLLPVALLVVWYCREWW